MTGLQLAMLSGTLLMAGGALLLARMVPAPPRLADVIGRIRPTPITLTPAHAAGVGDVESSLGAWAERYLPAVVWGTPPEQDLALLGRSRTSFYGSKLISATLGLLIGPMVAVGAMIIGIELPWVLPAAGSLLVAGVMWFMPNQELKDKARTARAEFSYALGAFVEMVALERLGGAAVPTALQRAAETGDSWVFTRLGTTLRRTQYTGRSPWDALATMGRELGLPDLVDFSDIMRLAGADGTQVYDSLRARAAAMRHHLLNTHISRANEASERIAIPVGLLVFVLAAVLVTPAFLRML